MRQFSLQSYNTSRVRFFPCWLAKVRHWTEYKLKALCEFNVMFGVKNVEYSLNSYQNMDWVSGVSYNKHIALRMS